MLSRYWIDSKGESSGPAEIPSSDAGSGSCILFLTHKWTPILARRVSLLRKTGLDVWVVYDMRDEALSTVELSRRFGCRVFPVCRPKRLPAWLSLYDHNFSHLMVLHFFECCPHYDYYWCYENDVHAESTARPLFDHYLGSSRDLIAVINSQDQSDAWTIANGCLPAGFGLFAYQPVARFSNGLLAAITGSLSSTHFAYFEVFDLFTCHSRGMQYERIDPRLLGEPYEYRTEKLELRDVKAVSGRLYHPIAY